MFEQVWKKACDADLFVRFRWTKKNEHKAQYEESRTFEEVSSTWDSNIADETIKTLTKKIVILKVAMKSFP